MFQIMSLILPVRINPGPACGTCVPAAAGGFPPPAASLQKHALPDSPVQPVEGEAVFQDREDFLSPVHFPQADKGLQQLYLLRGQFFSVLAPELRRLPEQRRVDAGRIAVHLLLRLPVLPEQAQPVQDFPDPGPLRGAEDIVRVLTVVASRGQIVLTIGRAL